MNNSKKTVQYSKKQKKEFELQNFFQMKISLFKNIKK